jgi:hypothetical protein
MSKVFGASRIAFAGLLCQLGYTACSPPPAPRPLEMEPIGTIKNLPPVPAEEPGDSGVTAPNSGTAPAATAVCTAGDLDNAQDILGQCEVPLPRAADVPSLKDKLEVKVVTASPSIAPGGHVELQITLHNKSGDSLPVYFSGDPGPRFDVEAVDGKGRRVDLPTAKWPGYPKGVKPELHDAKSSKIVFEKNSTARFKASWDAVKTKWAPEKAKSWEGRGNPRVASGPLAPGKYVLRVVLPILGDFSEQPKAPIEVLGP